MRASRNDDTDCGRTETVAECSAAGSGQVRVYVGARNGIQHLAVSSTAGKITAIATKVPGNAIRLCCAVYSGCV